MPQWSEITRSESFKKMSNEEKLTAKQNFYREVVSASPKFTSLPTSKQDAIKNTFATLDPNEAIPQDDLNFNSIVNQAASVIGEGAKGIAKDFKALTAPADAIVNKVADFIEPKEINPKSSKLKQYGVDFPRVVAGEFIRGYQPSTLVPFVAGMKALGPTAKVAGKAIWDNIPEGKLKDGLTWTFKTGHGAPKEYLDLKQQATLEAQAGAREAEDIGKKLFYAQKNMSYTSSTGEVIKVKKNQMLPAEMQQNIGKVFRGEWDAVEALKSHPQFKEISEIASQGRAIQDKWSKALLDSGIPKGELEETIQNNIGSYMARMYTSKLIKNKDLGLSTDYLRLRLAGLKSRQEISEEVRKALGEIKEPALPVATRVKEISETVAADKLFKKIASNKDWVAETNITGEMKQIPDAASYGALRKKWVTPEIANDLRAVIKAKEVADPLMGLYNKSLSYWKYGKVVLNPATHIRNIMTNTLLLDLSGTNHATQARLFPKVITDYLNKGEIYQSAVKHGAIGQEFVGADIKAIKDWYEAGTGSNLNRWVNLLKIPGNVYQGEEQVAKLIKFAHGLELKQSPQEAARQAQKWLFDYNQIPEAVKFVKHIAPFFTFTYKSTPRLVEALVNNPLRVYKYKALIDGINNASVKMQGMSPEDYAREQKNLPSWVLRSAGGLPANLLLPYRDKYDRTQWLNLEYILPLGQSPDILEQGLSGLISNPVFNIASDIQKNKDFRGKSIIPVGSDKYGATKAIAEHIYRQLAPSFAPAIGSIKGGYSWEKVMAAIQGREDFAGRTRELGPVLLDTLSGIKITPVDVQESEKFKYLDLQKKLIEINKEAYGVRRSQALTDDEREKKMQDIHTRMQRIKDEMRNIK